MQNPDICVLGAGPAGIAIAYKLKAMGFNVLLLTGDRPPHIPFAQSISPGVITLLKSNGVEVDFQEAGCIPIIESTLLWSDKCLRNIQPQGFIADRRIFDLCLLKYAVQNGVPVKQSANIISIRRLHDTWEILIKQNGKYIKLNSNFLVDASGKKSIIHGLKKRVGPATLALTGMWKNASFPGYSTLVESAENYWLWGATLGDGICHVTVFLDPLNQPNQGKSNLVAHYREALKKTRLFNGCLKGSLMGQLSAYDATPFYYKHPVGKKFIKVGEACMGTDPISGQGLQQAILNAIQGAIVVNTVLSNPIQESSAHDFYIVRQQEMVNRHLQLCSTCYAEATPWQELPFWRNRISHAPSQEKRIIIKPNDSEQNVLFRFSEEVRFVSTNCIIQDQITQKTGLVHPALKQPIVFWGNQQIASILGNIRKCSTSRNLILEWSKKIPADSAEKLYYWLKQNGLLLPMNSCTENQLSINQTEKNISSS